MGNIAPRCMGQDYVKMWQHKPHTVSKRERERERETETETEYARAVSPLLEKDAAGTPEVPAPVVYEGGEAMLSHDLVAETETETDTETETETPT